MNPLTLREKFGLPPYVRCMDCGALVLPESAIGPRCPACALRELYGNPKPPKGA